MVEFKGVDPKKKGRKRADLLGRVPDPRNVDDHREGTVASRMLVNSKAGGIAVFSFDEEEGLLEHAAPFDAVVTARGGECELWVALEIVMMAAGQTIIFPENVPHALSAVTRFTKTLTMIRG